MAREQLDPVPPASDDRAFTLGDTRHHFNQPLDAARAGLYQTNHGGPPTIRISAARITATLVNLPENPVQDFELDLGWVFSDVLMVSPTPPTV